MTRDEQPEQHPANPWSDDWDRQIAADANNGKLARLAGRALLDHAAGLSSEL